MSQRCGTCINCQKLERVKTRVLACCNPPFCHADDGVIMVWNDMLKHLPCLNPPVEKNSQNNTD